MDKVSNLYLTLEIPRDQSVDDDFKNLVSHMAQVQHLYFNAGENIERANSYIYLAKGFETSIGLVVKSTLLQSENFAQVASDLNEIVLCCQADDDPVSINRLLDEIECQSLIINLRLNCHGKDWKKWSLLCSRALDTGGWLSIEISKNERLKAVLSELYDLQHYLRALRTAYPSSIIRCDPFLRSELVQHPCLVGACRSTHCHSAGKGFAKPYFIYLSDKGEFRLEFPEIASALSIGQISDLNSLITALGKMRGFETWPHLFQLVCYTFQIHVVRKRTPFIWWKSAISIEGNRKRWTSYIPIGPNSFIETSPELVFRQSSNGTCIAVDSHSKEQVYVSINKGVRQILRYCNGQNSVETIIKDISRDFSNKVQNPHTLSPTILSSLDHLRLMNLIHVTRSRSRHTNSAPASEQFLYIEKLAIELTKKCNLRCWYCYSNAGRKYEDELNFNDLTSALRRYAFAGCHSFLFTGGEPILRKDVVNIVKYAAIELGMGRNSLFTNGILLTPALIKQLAPFLMNFNISLDGPQVVHEAARGKGSFEKTLVCLKSLRDEGCKFNLQFSITGENWSYLNWIFDTASEFKADELTLSPVLNSSRSSISPNRFLPKEFLGILYDRVKNTNRDNPNGMRVTTPLLDYDDLKTYCDTLISKTLVFPAMLPNGTIIPQLGLGEEWKLAEKGKLILTDSANIEKYREITTRAINMCFDEVTRVGVTTVPLQQIYELGSVKQN